MWGAEIDDPALELEKMKRMKILNNLGIKFIINMNKIINFTKKLNYTGNCQKSEFRAEA